MTMIAVWFFILLNVSNGFTTYQNESLPLGLVQELHLRPNMTVRLTLNSTLNPLDINDKFWSFEAHSFSSNDHLSLSKTELPKGYVLYICEECFGKNCFFLTYILKYFCMNWSLSMKFCINGRFYFKMCTDCLNIVQERNKCVLTQVPIFVIFN